MDASIVIPMHNEEEALGALLPALESFHRDVATRLGVEIILVDDGSTDRSFDVAWTWAERSHFPVKVLRLNPREGIGGALRAGFPFAAGRWIVTYDADQSYPLNKIAELVETGDGGADLVTASPWRADAGAAGISVRRLWPSLAATALYRLRLGRDARGITCFTCGFRAYRRRLIGDLTPRANGFLATAEMLVRALRAGFRVAEVPAQLAPRRHGRSKMRLVRTTLSHLRFLIFLR